MAIIGQAVQLSTEETIDSEGHQTYTSRYRVQSDDPYENPISVREAIGIPDYGDEYGWGGVYNLDAFCNNKHTAFWKEEDSHLFWIVTTTHSTKPSNRSRSGGSGGGGIQTNPLLETWKISGSYVQGTRLESKHTDGRPIINSAKEKKEIEVPDGYDTLNLEGPSPTISLSTRAQAVFHCNSTAIWGLSPRMLLLPQWQYEILHHGPLEYVYHRLTFWIKYTLWDDDFLDVGTRELVDATIADVSKRYKPITFRGTHDSHLLNGAGRLVDLTILPDGFTMPCKAIKEFDFTALGFPDPLPGPFV